jgi:hypothetical protein
LQVRREFVASLAPRFFIARTLADFNMNVASCCHLSMAHPDGPPHLAFLAQPFGTTFCWPPSEANSG